MAEYTTGTFTYSNAFLAQIMGSYKTVPSQILFHTPTVHLYSDAAVVPSPTSVIGDFTPSEMSFTGYTADTPVLSEPLNVGVDVQGALANCLFIAGPGAISNPGTAVGYWVQSDTTLIGAEKFPNASTVPFGASGDFLDLAMICPLANNVSP